MICNREPGFFPVSNFSDEFCCCSDMLIFLKVQLKLFLVSFEVVINCFKCTHRKNVDVFGLFGFV